MFTNSASDITPVVIRNQLEWKHGRRFNECVCDYALVIGHGICIRSAGERHDDRDR